MNSGYKEVYRALWSAEMGSCQVLGMNSSALSSLGATEHGELCPSECILQK